MSSHSRARKVFRVGGLRASYGSTSLGNHPSDLASLVRLVEKGWLEAEKNQRGYGIHLYSEPSGSKPRRRRDKPLTHGADKRVQEG